MIKGILSINNVCNLKCKMCDYGQKNNTAGLSQNWTADTCLTPQEWLTKFKNLGIDWVHIHGVEPLLYKDLADFLKLVSPGRYIYITTNGWFIEKYIDSINKYVSKLAISIDGPEEIHDSIRGVKGSYARALSGIKQLKQLNTKCELIVSYAITPDNIYCIKQTYDFFKKLNIKIVFNHFNYIANQSNIGIYNPADIDTTELFSAIQSCKSAKFLPGLKTKNELDTYYKQSPTKHINLKCNVIEETLAGKRYTMISDGSFIVSARCWYNLNSKDPLVNNKTLLDFNNKILKTGLSPQCQRLCCAGKCV